MNNYCIINWEDETGSWQIIHKKSSKKTYYVIGKNKDKDSLIEQAKVYAKHKGIPIYVNGKDGRVTLKIRLEDM